MALAAAIVGGVGLAVLFSLSRWIELSLFPFAVILQVTPIVAIAPLILIYVDNTELALLICAWIVAFFPILSNTIARPATAPITTCATCSSSTARRAGSTLTLSAPALGAALFPGRPADRRAACR